MSLRRRMTYAPKYTGHLHVYWRACMYWFMYRRRWGACLVEVEQRAPVRALHRPNPDTGGCVPKKPEPGKRISVNAKAAKASPNLTKFPVLTGYLTDLMYEGGTGEREPSWLMIRPQGGVWSVTLKDPTEGRLLRIQVDSDAAIFPSLEALLASDVCPWEPDKYAEASRPKGKKPKA